MKMINQVYSKPDVQKMLTALRKIPVFTVGKTEDGYVVTHNPTDRLIFKASKGSNGYLCRHPEDLFLTK